ncbi:MAG TPA: SRPBCC family protein [Thermoanaerobaculia bacterium]|jgi:carbon monoxide dehydrogenase subunit G|nr:SRPBCC family protein [Thermoanaerobaculia bacterium]
MHVHRQLEIQGTRAQLWRCLTDPEVLKRWVSSLVDDTPEDPERTSGVGVVSTMRLREGNKVVAYRSVVTEWEHERRLAIRISGGMFAEGMEMDVAYEISSRAGGGMLLDYDVRVPLKGFFLLMSPLIWLMSKKNANTDLTKLQTLVPTV